MRPVAELLHRKVRILQPSLFKFLSKIYSHISQSIRDTQVYVLHDGAARAFVLAASNSRLKPASEAETMNLSAEIWDLASQCYENMLMCPHTCKQLGKQSSLA